MKQNVLYQLLIQNISTIKKKKATCSLVHFMNQDEIITKHVKDELLPNVAYATTLDLCIVLLSFSMLFVVILFNNILVCTNVILSSF